MAKKLVIYFLNALMLGG